MLVLSRAENQYIDIGGVIEIVVLIIRGDRVRLGITAPKETPVHRREVAETIARESLDNSRDGS